MKKTILITGATDGVGYKTAAKLAEKSKTLLLHGRSEDKLSDVQNTLKKNYPDAVFETFIRLMCSCLDLIYN